ncbi:MAG: ferredoxin [Peptococcaceae bacterium]|nr:ferredoxin [Peptococcaceae bacterium]
MARKPYIDISECIACGNCEGVCPAVFKLEENYGYAEVIDPGAASEAEIQEAVNYCPASCIHWEE